MSNQERTSQVGGQAHRLSESSHVVFLGLYNADAFQAKIENWLPRLDMRGTSLLISDNASTDSTLEWIAPLAERVSVPFSIVRNGKNLGGYGNLASNLKALTNAKWVTTLHQDDVYKHDHIQAHRQSLKNAPSNLGMIFSEARSVDQYGQMVPYPRAHWLFAEREDPIRVFLAHLRHHVYPFSGATFATDMLSNFPIPYNSTAFPDTEMVMKMIVDYQVTRARGVTVDYLENPISESHSLDSAGRDLGAYQALVRVFSHSSFQKLCLLLPDDKVPAFFRGLASGIDLRFSHKGLASLLQQAAFEITLGHLAATPSRTRSFTEQSSQASSRVFLDYANAAGRKTIQQSARLEETQISSIKGNFEILRNLLLKLSKLLPRSLRRLLFIQLMATSVGKRLFPQFDFDWDKN